MKKIIPFVLVLGLTSCASLPNSQPVSTLFPKGIPHVRAAIENTDNLNFMIDSGVDPSVIDESLARCMNLPIDESETKEAEGGGEGAGLEVRRSSINGLRLGSTTYPPIAAVAADLSGFGKALNIPLAGILGHSFLKDRVVRIDYPAGQIAVAETLEGLAPKKTQTSQRYAVTLVHNSAEDTIPVFEIQVNGQPVQVSLDTGKSGGVEFFRSAAEKLDLTRVAERESETVVTGARGKRTIIRSMLKSINLGPFVVVDPEISISQKQPTNELREGNAGNKFLRNFVVTIEDINHQIIFEK